MKILLQALVLFSFVMSMPSWSMDHTSTDIESSDSENESDEMYIHLEHPGAYLAYFNVNAINKSTEKAHLAIGIYINNNRDKYKEYAIAPNSILRIEDFIPVTSHNDDLIQIKFNAPDSVDVENFGIDFIQPEPKTKL